MESPNEQTGSIVRHGLQHIENVIERQKKYYDIEREDVELEVGAFTKY